MRLPRISEEEQMGRSEGSGEGEDRGAREGSEQEKLQSGHEHQEKTNRPKRTRGRRSAKEKGSEEEGVKEVWLHNSSGKPQFLAAMGHAARFGKGRVVAIINQEHQCDERTWMDAQAQAMAKGWRAIGAQAVSTGEKGASAGVAIATPKEISAGVARQGDHNCAPNESRGRLTKLWVQDILPCGATLLSAYMWHSE